MAGTNFVTIITSGRVLVEISLEQGRLLASSKGCFTNIPSRSLPAGEARSNYDHIWRVELSTRMIKTDLPARPIFCRQRSGAETHIGIAFTALNLAHSLQGKAG